MGTVVAFRRFVEVRERHRARAAAHRGAEEPGSEAVLTLDGELVPPPAAPPAGRVGRLPLARRGPAKAGPRGIAGD